MPSPDARVFKALSEVMPGTKLAWPIGKAPPLPWFVYLRANGGEVFADNGNYHLLPRYRVELYVKENDPDLLARFEAAVASLGPYTRRDSWLESQSCLMYAFHLTLLPATE